MLALNNWYRPLLPLHKVITNEPTDTGDVVTVKPPFWRRDLELPEDLVEEVGRLYGFNQLPVVLPERSGQAVTKNRGLELLHNIRTLLTRVGANELLTYSFVPEQLLKKAGQDPIQAFHIRNAISPELQYYRLSLTPSLLEKVHSNIKAGYDEFVLYEIGKAHSKLHIDAADGLPTEQNLLSLVVAAKDTPSVKKRGAPYYAARAYLDYLAQQLGIELLYIPLPSGVVDSLVSPFEPARSAIVQVKDTHTTLGVIGEFTATLQHASHRFRPAGARLKKGRATRRHRARVPPGPPGSRDRRRGASARA